MSNFVTLSNAEKMVSVSKSTIKRWMFTDKNGKRSKRGLVSYDKDEDGSYLVDVVSLLEICRKKDKEIFYTSLEDLESNEDGGSKQVEAQENSRIIDLLELNMREVKSLRDKFGETQLLLTVSEAECKNKEKELENVRESLEKDFKHEKGMLLRDYKDERKELLREYEEKIYCYRKKLKRRNVVIILSIMFLFFGFVFISYIFFPEFFSLNWLINLWS